MYELMPLLPPFSPCIKRGKCICMTCEIVAGLINVGFTENCILNIRSIARTSYCSIVTVHCVYGRAMKGICCWLKQCISTQVNVMPLLLFPIWGYYKTGQQVRKPVESCITRRNLDAFLEAEELEFCMKQFWRKHWVGRKRGNIRNCS